MNEYLHMQSTHEHTKLAHIYIFTTPPPPQVI